MPLPTLGLRWCLAFNLEWQLYTLMSGSKAAPIRLVDLVVKCLQRFKHAIRRLRKNNQSGSSTFPINYDILCIQKVWIVLQSLRDFGMVMIRDILKSSKSIRLGHCSPLILSFEGEQSRRSLVELSATAGLQEGFDLEIARLSWTPHSWESESLAAALQTGLHNSKDAGSWDRSLHNHWSLQPGEGAQVELDDEAG